MSVRSLILAAGLIATAGSGWASGAGGITRRTLLSDRVEECTFIPAGFDAELPFLVITPVSSTAKPWSVLFLLHGAGRHHRTLIENPPTREVLLHQPYLIVCPNTRSGWYVNSPVVPSGRYSDAFDELCRLVPKHYPVRGDRGGWAIAGWSMGGYGSMYQAEEHPERFGFVGGIIALLDFPKEEGLPVGQRYTVPRSVFGDDPDVWRRLNPIARVDRLRRTPVFLVIARQAFDFTMNENFLRVARAENVAVQTRYIDGGHSAAARDAGVPLVLEAVRDFFATNAAPATAP
jgi:S-formylglutathione hydrolase FrmB